MKFEFIEKMAAEGQIRPEAVEIIYKDCAELLEKTADMGQFLQSLGTNILTIAGATAVVGGAVGVYGAVQDSKAKSQIEAIKSSIVAHPSIDTKDKDKAAARFDEICRYAPSLAVNEPVMQRLVHSKYKTGLTDHDVNSLIGIQVKMTPNPYTYAEKSQGYMPKTAAEKAGDMLANVHIALEKTAGLGDLLTKVIQHPLAPLATGVGLGAVGLGAAAWNSYNTNSALKKSFNQVMISSPNGILAENPDKARAAFDTLAHFSPSIASEPHAAQAFMTKLVDYSLRSGGDVGPQVSDLKDLTEIQRNMGGSKTLVDNISTIMGASAIGSSLGKMPPPVKQSLPTVPEGFSAPLHYHS